jgi:hypothetical protein
MNHVCFLSRYVAAALLAITMVPVQSADSAPQRVLFLGNSVFNYEGGVCQSFEGFCAESGLRIQAVSQLDEAENSHGIEFLGLGRIPYSLPEVAASEPIHTLIRSGQFDFVVLEARRVGYLMPDWGDRPSGLRLGDPLPYERNRGALGRLHQTIVRSGAQTVLYMHPGHHSLVDWKHPVAQVYNRLRSDLERMEIDGVRHSVRLVPASLLWLDARKRFGLEAWYADSNHGTALARFASGCMLFTYITGNDPRKNSFRELARSWKTSANAPAEYAFANDATWIKDQVWRYYTTRPQSPDGN